MVHLCHIFHGNSFLPKHISSGTLPLMEGLCATKGILLHSLDAERITKRNKTKQTNKN